MAYQVTARKWRPQRFADLVGQDHIARTLRNAIVTGRIAHAYLFVGPRGIGKTTSARIFAKALNCMHPVNGEPCCECSSCKAIAAENSVDVIEIDAATHTQVDKAREICEDVLHLPISSKYKIYIIDEVHMLSKSAWNALLKTIEEPPAHAKFIFATTEVNKVLPTVISRCQRFDLRRIPSELIAQRLAYIASEEKINISRQALDVIARAADGGMRDAQSLLDQLVSFFGSAENSGEAISEEQALSLFGLTAPGEMEALMNAILSDNRTDVILCIHKFAEQGKNLETLFEEILSWLRGIMISLLLPHPESVLDEAAEKIQAYRAIGSGKRPDMIQSLLEQLAGSSYFLRDAINKQVFLETLLMKAMRNAHAVRIEDLILRLNQLRKSGELAGLDKVPSLAQIPVPAPQVIYVNQSLPTAPSAEKKTESVIEPEPVKKAEPEVVKPEPVKEISPQIEPEPVKEVAPQVEPEPVKEIPVQTEKKSEQKTENVEETSSPEEDTDASEPEDCAPEFTETLELPEEPESGIPLKERFSAENLWEKLAEQSAKVFGASFAGLMSDGMPSEISGSKLVVLFDEKQGSQAYAYVMREKKRLRELLQSITREKCADLQFEKRSGLLSEIKVVKKTLNQLKKEAAEIPIVAQSTDLFAGMVVDVLE